jgi:hypothetical protein
LPAGAFLFAFSTQSPTVPARAQGKRRTMNRNIVIIVIAVLAVATVVLGYQLYQERHQKSGVDISIGDRGISVKAK